MHEFSLATEVINLAQREAEKNKVSVIQEISIEVGNLSGVDADAFQTALDVLVRGSILESALINIVKSTGIGKCNACNIIFEMEQRMDTCPQCKSFPSEINGGQDFKVLSLLVD